MKFDVAVIGGGPAGLTACVYLCRAGMKTICFEKLALGGQVNLSLEVTNFPGFESIPGFELCEKFKQHALHFETNFVYEEVKELAKDKSNFRIKTSTNEYFAKRVIIACGCKPRQLGLKEEVKFVGKGISYCANCDGPFFKNKTVAVVGGGHTAFDDAKYLSKLCNKVYIINRSEKFRVDEKKKKDILKLKNVELISSSVVEKIIGKEKVNKIELKNVLTKEKIQLKVDGLFVAIGLIPDLSFLNVEVEKDENGFIRVDENMSTNVKNLFACGDINNGKLKQIVCACSDGAKAASACIEGGN